MKRFKKVLALVLAGVLALAMLTACGETTDPDSIMPEDGTPEVVLTVNNMAANKGLGQVKYSAKYSAVTKALLENWLEYTNNKINALTCTLLFVQDRNAPHYIKIYENEQ